MAERRNEATAFCSDCGKEIDGNSKFCAHCGKSTNLTQKQEPEEAQCDKQQAIEHRKIECPQCGSENIMRGKKSSFWHVRLYDCPDCKFQGPMPLTTSMKFLYWTITAIVLYIILCIVTGGQGKIGLLGILAPIWLINDGRLNKNLKEYWKKNRPEETYNPPKESGGIKKGIIYSIIAIVITIVFIYVLYDGNSADGTNSTGRVTENWQPFNSTEGQFKIDFPVYPTREESKEKISGIDVSFVQYTSAINDGTTYLVTYVEYSDQFDLSDSKTVLTNAVNGAVNSDAGNKLTSSAFSSYKTSPTIDCAVYNSKEKLFMQYRYILIGQKLYGIGAASYSESIKNYDKFTSSFQKL